MGSDPIVCKKEHGGFTAEAAEAAEEKLDRFYSSAAVQWDPEFWTCSS
jgi:hypothetical protein